MVPICSCSKNKDGSSVTFTVRTADGQTKVVKSEQEARAITRISGGSYTRT